MAKITTVWILHDGRIGHLNQCIGVAEALDVSYDIIDIPYVGVLKSFFVSPIAFLQDRLMTAPLPDVVIGAGRRTTVVLEALKKAYPVIKTVKLMSPMSRLGMKTRPSTWDKGLLDVIALPAHEVFCKMPSRVVETLGAPNRVNAKNLSEARKVWSDKLAYVGQKKLAVLVGGSTKHFLFDEIAAKHFAEEVKAFAKSEGYGLLVTTSRRTGAAQVSVLEDAFSAENVYFWSGEGENPILGYFAEADAFVVTAESTSMVSEVCGTGKPVYLYGVDAQLHVKGAGKFNDFYRFLAEEGRVKALGQRFDVLPEHPLNDAQLVADRIRSLFDV